MTLSPGRIARGSVLAVALLLAACYPELDWREVTSTTGRYSVLMPAKPEHAQREVVVGDTTLSMTMASVRKAGMAFGVAYAEIPAGRAQRAELVVAARDALSRNIDGRITSEREVRIDGAVGREFFSDGSVGGQPMRLAARVFASDAHFYQVVLVGQSDRLEKADVALFLGSFRLTEN
ncbi:MAG: hypothetical protein HC807_07860 [Gammaproteobacteria bacterium]|nr:hypothetical protein [Gammaproteobacteria bacterium]